LSLKIQQRRHVSMKIFQNRDNKFQEARNKLIALKNGGFVCLGTYFSIDNDILITMNKDSNDQINYSDTRLIPAVAHSDNQSLGTNFIFHYCGNDTTQWNLNGTYI